MMDETVKQVAYIVITALISYFGTDRVNSFQSDKIIETYATIIQQQAKLMEECK
jgi:hypothetical protein